jgi:hypothetical protein
MSKPDEVIRAFIRDFKIWNDESYEASEKDEELGMDFADQEYDVLINKYCKKTVSPQGVAYGSDSSHCPEREIIVTLTQYNEKAIVITKHTDEDDFVTDYEYHLELVSGDWKLISLKYVDLDSKYECL